LPEQYALCATCILRIKPLACKPVAVTPTYTMRVFCVGAYEDPLKKFVLAKMYSDYTACYYIAQLIADYSLFKKLEIDFIVPVPLHWRRYAKRGYNQSAEIARYLSKTSGIPILHAIKRVKATKYQSRCDKDERLENVKEAFVCGLSDQERELVRGKRLLLIDDVMTTGATLTAVAKVLTRLKPAEIVACVLART
jgi:ComF family protein